MIDLSKLKYRTVLVTEGGSSVDVSDAAESVTWEESENEISMRIRCTFLNVNYGGSRLSSAAKPGCVIIVTADWGEGSAEVARGTIVDWEVSLSGSKDSFSVLAYDDLYNLQQSQDNRYLPEGAGTQSALSAIFSEWGIPLGEYRGPNISHVKTLFKNDYLSDIIAQLLDAAVKQGGERCVIREAQGSVSIVPRGSNSVVYYFDEDSNVTVAQDKVSTQGLVTRVKVVAAELKDQRPGVDAVLDGRTEFGIRQRIYNRKEEDTLEMAKSAARQILDENGEPKRSTTVEAPDVPIIRKGDKVNVRAGTLNGIYIVTAVQHDASSCSMNMSLEEA